MPVLLNDADPREAAAARDRERLQGVWHFVTGRRKVQLAVHGDRFIARFNNGDVYEGTFDLAPTKKPKAMDMAVTDGPAPYKGLTARCIYAIDGDHLVWCPAQPGAAERPQAFPPSDSHELLCVVLRRSP